MPRDSKGRFIKGEKPIEHGSDCSCFRCTHIVWNKGKAWHEDVKNKISVANTGKTHPETQGDKNWHWKGEKVGYIGLHEWINQKKGKPSKCEECGSTRRLEWANKSYKYKRVLEDWIALCHKCHMARDAKDGWGIALKRFPDLKRYYDKRKIKNMIAWTDWRCSNCETIIYNTDLGARYKIGAHKRKHK